MKRREFLKTFAGMAALTVVPRHVLGGVGYTAPSDQLTKGIIGVGGMGRGHYGYAGTVQFFSNILHTKPVFFFCFYWVAPIFFRNFVR